MSRPEPCILFAQTFTHPQLDEYVDEVLFAEPVVITGCEFLELNAPLSTPHFSLMGATYPPSFAMEIFVHCEGESRFRRLCQPFLYSHSSSNILDVEAVVTNHLVLRGCYRSITLVVYGNTAEDLGQFSVDIDLDNSLASLVSSPLEGKLEDLPPALLSVKLTIEELITATDSFSISFSDLDISSEMRLFLHLALKIYQISYDESTLLKVLRTVISAVGYHFSSDYCGMVVSKDDVWFRNSMYERENLQKIFSAISVARNELLELYKELQALPGNGSILQDASQEPDLIIVTSQLLVDTLYRLFPFLQNSASLDIPVLYQNKQLILGLSMLLLVCLESESCFFYVNGGGMEQIVSLLGDDMQGTTAFTLLLLGVVETVTRHAVGCEAFLGWWPRNDDNVPASKSEGYSNLLKLLLRKQRHDVASLASYILHRLRIYELASRYELSVLSIVSDDSLDCISKVDTMNALGNAAAQMKQLVKSLNLCGPFEDPSPVANARKLLDHWKSEGHLSYNATSDYIALSKHNFLMWDVDLHLLSLLKERGFFPLSAALLSYHSMHSTTGSASQIFVEIAVFFQSLLLSILFSRSGLTFLLLQPEITSTIILSLQCFEEGSKLECPTLRQAAVLMSNGFFCHPQEVAMILEIHLRVGYAIDRLLSASPSSDEILWVLWDLCSIARSDCGRQAILSIGYFHEAIEVLLGALRSCKDSESISSSNGTSRLDLATFHSAAEIFEILVSDSTSFSLRTWIGYAVELHKALHLSSPGSHRKDAPTRLLEWIDAGVVYHKNGAIGLLRYAAVLASGGDAHLSSASVLVSDSIDVENVVGDSSDASDSQVLDILLGKLVNDKFFDGITLRNTSIVQLTTAFRILAFISEDTDVAGYLFEEGAMTLIYVVLLSCKHMLEQSSNTYDYLVDGAECNSTSDLLLEWSQEQSLVDLILPSLVLLINLLRKLREAKEIYQNKKLLNALLHLHREVSPRLAAYVADFYSHYPQLVLGFGAICRLVASVVAFWPVFGWKPSLFCCLLNNVQDTSSLPFGPKDACSVMYLLSDLFPKEGVWLWKNGIPPFSAVSTLSIETVLGPEVEKDIQWYLKPEHLTVLLTRLTPLLERIAQIVLQFSFTTLTVIKDMLRIFIIRIACQRAECADVLLRPLICWMEHTISETIISDADHFKMYGSLNFISNLLEHPCAKILLSRTSSIRVLVNALKRCCDACIVDGKLDLDNWVDKDAPSFLSWYMPLLKSLALIFDSQTSTQIANISSECPMVEIVPEDGSMIGHLLLRLCQVLPVGRELLACMATLKEFISSDVGRRTLKEILLQSQASALEEHKGNGNDAKEYFPDSNDWRIYPPFLQCWEKLLSCLDADDDPLTFAVETLYLLSSCALSLCVENHNCCGVSILKYLFGLALDPRSALTSPDERSQDVLKLIILLEQKIGDKNFVHSTTQPDLQKITDVVKVLRLLLEAPLVSSGKVEDIPSDDFFLPTDSYLCANTKSLLLSSLRMIADDDGAAFNHVWRLIEITETENEPFSLGGFAEKFIWECPDTSSERVLTTSSGGKRKIASTEVSAKRARDSSTSEAGGSNASRGFTTPSTPVPTRRDTFRQRKPNTSRPPSMHVDDYVARERNTDALNSASHAGSSQRVGSNGRPPSIHVDEFMARQRERQSSAFSSFGEVAQAMQTAYEDQNNDSKPNKSQQLKADLDDELQGIDIVFDEESGSEDRIPFPQSDDILQSNPLVAGESSPGSVVEETEGDTNDGTQLSQVGSSVPSEDVESRSESSLKRSVQPEISGSFDMSFSSEKTATLKNSMDKRAFIHSYDESNNVSLSMGSRGFEIPRPGNSASVPSSLLNVRSGTNIQPILGPPFLQRDSTHKASSASSSSGPYGSFDHKIPINQPPLPPMPHPNVSGISSSGVELVQSLSAPYIPNVRDVQIPFIPGYTGQPFIVSGAANSLVQSENVSSLNSMVSITAQPFVENKLMWNTDSPSNSVTSSRPTPPLPPTPPPFPAPLTQSSSNFSSQSSLYLQSTNVGHSPQLSTTPVTDLGIFSSSGSSLSFSLPSFPPAMLVNRPPVTGTLFGSPPQQHGQQHSTNISNPTATPTQLSVQPLPVQPPPPPPPQPRAPHPSQNLGLPIPIPQPQFEQMMPLPQGSIQVQMQPLQMQQQIHLPQLQVFYPQQQQEHILQSVPPSLEVQAKNSTQEAESAILQQKDSGMTLQQYFSSPEAIQSLLSDRDKLCQLLEQHPKLMQMLQERLGQL